MRNDTATLNKLCNHLLDNLNYFQTRLSAGRTDVLAIINLLHSSLSLSGFVVCYDDVKKRWHFV